MTLFLEANAESPAEIILDFDATENRIHGKQQGRFYHGDYDCYSYLPLAFLRATTCSARLRTADRGGTLDELESRPHDPIQFNNAAPCPGNSGRYTKDMHRPHITATALHVPAAEDKIAFDKFHVVTLFADGVDRVRRAENKPLLADGDRTIAGSKYVWLMNPANMKASTKARFAELKGLALKVGRACATKEVAQGLWHYTTRRGAAKAWLGLCDWLQRSRQEPRIKVGGTIRRNLLGILNAIVHGVTNGAAEGINSKVQELKKRAHGYRNESSFIAAIYFHLGGFDLYPRPSCAHTNR